MPRATDNPTPPPAGRARSKKIAAPAAISAPEMPPETPEEEALSCEIVQMLESLSRDLQQGNLAAAVALAQQALSGRGPLVEHFAELGRRFGHTLREPPKPSLKVLEGGRG